MNLRIAPEYLRFRISDGEFETLLTTGILQAHTQCSEKVRCDYSIHTHPERTSTDGRTLDLTTKTTETGLGFDLTVFADGIARMQSGKVGKDGLSEHQALASGDLLTISLEIDLHSKKSTGN